MIKIFHLLIKDNNMKIYDLINQSIGNKVILIGKGDVGIDIKLRRFVYNKTELTLMRLTKGGMAIVSFNGQEFKVPPRNIKIIEDNVNLPIGIP